MFQSTEPLCAEESFRYLVSNLGTTKLSLPRSLVKKGMVKDCLVHVEGEGGEMEECTKKREA